MQEMSRNLIKKEIGVYRGHTLTAEIARAKKSVIVFWHGLFVGIM